MVVNSIKLQGKLKRMDVRLGESKNSGKEYASANMTLVVDENELIVRMFAMRHKNNGEERSDYTGIMTLYSEAKALHKTIKYGDADAVVESMEDNETIVETIEECEGIKCSSWKDFKYCRFEMNPRVSADGSVIKPVEITANYVNRFKENEEFNYKNYFEIVGMVKNVPVELEDVEGNPYLKFAIVVPELRKGYTRADGVVVEDTIKLHEIEVTSHNEAAFDDILNEFEKGCFASVNGEIIRTVERIEKEVEVAHVGFGRQKEVEPHFETKITSYIEILGGYRYDYEELEDKPEFNQELFAKGLEELEKVEENLLSKNQEQQEKPRGFGGSNKSESKKEKPRTPFNF